MISVKLSKSDNPKKKYKVIVVKEGGRKKTIHFGSAGMSDYTKHTDPERKKRYIARHRKRENWNDPYTAGFWSRWLLWDEPTIKASKSSISRRHNIKFI